MFLYQLAEHLHITLAEVKALSSDELTGWMAFFEHKRNEAETEKHVQRAQAIKQNRSVG